MLTRLIGPFPTEFIQTSQHATLSYSWWLKSCTSWYGKYTIIYRVSSILGGAGFQPSTIVLQCWFYMHLKSKNCFICFSWLKSKKPSSAMRLHFSQLARPEQNGEYGLLGESLMKVPASKWILSRDTYNSWVFQSVTSCSTLPNPNIAAVVFQPLIFRCELLVSGNVSTIVNTLVGGFNPFEKYARQIGSFPQFSGWKLPSI